MRDLATDNKTLANAGWLLVAESWASGLLAILLLFEIAVGILLVAIDLPTASFHVPRWVTVPLLVVLSPVNFVLVARIWDSLRCHEFPLPLGVAQKYLPATRGYRALYAFIFLFYAACGVFMAWMWTAAIDRSIHNGLELVPIIGVVIIGMGFSFLANLQIVLLLAVLTNSLHAARWFWHRRLYADLVIGVSVFVPMLW